MSWPTGPPPMPPPGWYPDPEQAHTWRWFDGLRWSELRAPMPVPPGSDPRSLSAWFERSTACVKVAVRRAGPMVAAVWLVLGAAMWWVAVSAFDGDRGRELRRLLDLDGATFGPARGRVDLTDAEAERAWELLREIVARAVPWVVVLVVAGAVASSWSTVVVARVAMRHLGEPTLAEPPGRLARSALKRMPAVLLTGLVLALVVVGILAVASLPVVSVVVAGGGGAAVALTSVFAVLLVALAGAWLWGRLALAPVVAAEGGHGLGVRRSWELTHDDFWFVVGRLVITWLIAGAVSGVANIVLNGGFLLGFAVFLALFLVLQTLAAVAAMIVTVCSAVVIIDQLESADEDRRDPERSSTGSPDPYSYA